MLTGPPDKLVGCARCLLAIELVLTTDGDVVQRLPPGQRTAIEARVVDEQIAAATPTSEAVIRKRVALVIAASAPPRGRRTSSMATASRVR